MTGSPAWTPPELTDAERQRMADNCFKSMALRRHFGPRIRSEASFSFLGDGICRISFEVSSQRVEKICGARAENYPRLVSVHLAESVDAESVFNDIDLAVAGRGVIVMTPDL